MDNITDGEGIDPVNVEKRLCPSCSGQSATEESQYSLDDWKIVRCSDCEFVYLANPVEYEDLIVDHAFEKNAIKEHARRTRNRPISHWISKRTRWRLRLSKRDKGEQLLNFFPSGRVLDVGCGYGHALPEPLIPFGVEISKDMAKSADETLRQRGGYCIHAAAVEGTAEFDDGFFDGVLMRSFLEHETNPLQLLQQVHRVLSPTGVAYVRVPNFGSVNRKVIGRNWCGFRYPDHVNYFTPQSLRTMVEKAGLQMRILNKFNLAFDDNIKVVLTK